MTLLRRWTLATATTELIELSQLYHGPVAERIRATALGGLLLGHEFLWSDVLGVALGATAAALFESRVQSRANAGVSGGRRKTTY